MSTSTPTPQRSFKGLDLTARKALRRAKLLEAATVLYGEQGFLSVTVKDICQYAQLTERYFYESFKNNTELFKTVYLSLIDDLQQRVVEAVNQAAPVPEAMINAGLTVLLQRLHDEKGLARILFIDAVLVQDMYGSTIVEANARFERIIADFISALLPLPDATAEHYALLASGLNGYVAYVAMRWVVSDFSIPFEQVLAICTLTYQGILGKHQPTS